jgi:hypothetical protein
VITHTPRRRARAIVAENAVDDCTFSVLSLLSTKTDRPRDPNTIGATKESPMHDTIESCGAVLSGGVSARWMNRKRKKKKIALASPVGRYLRNEETQFQRRLSFRLVHLYAICTTIIIRVARSRSLINYCPLGSLHTGKSKAPFIHWAAWHRIATTVIKRVKKIDRYQKYISATFFSFFFSIENRAMMPLLRDPLYARKFRVRLERHNRLYTGLRARGASHTAFVPGLKKLLPFVHAYACITCICSSILIRVYKYI